MIVALDLGSTSIMAALYNGKLKELAQHSVPLPHIFADGGTVEIDPGVVRAALAKAVRGCLKAAGRSSKVGGIAITSQAQTFTILSRSGRPRMNFISWQDGRAVGACAALSKMRSMKDFASYGSFGSLIPGLQICHLKRLGDLGTGPGGGEAALLLPSWVALLLTGARAIDDNLAAMSGLYSLVEDGWKDSALAAAGVRATHLPEVVRSGRVFSRTGVGAGKFGLAAGIPVVFAGNDQTAGAYGAAVHEDNSVLVTLGTAQVVYTMHASMPRPAAASIRGPYPGGLYYRMAADSSGGSVINWARHVLAGCGRSGSFFEAAARATPGCNGLTFHVNGDGASYEWRGMGFQHGTPELARAILESLSDRMVRMVKALGLATGGRPFKIAGGGSRFAVWRAILEAKLGTRLEMTDASPLFGAARMARDAGLS